MAADRCGRHRRGVVGLAVGDAAIAQRGSRCASSSAIRGRAWTPAPTTAASSTPASTIPPGSLKARLCVEGRQLLYAFCARTTCRTSLRQAHRRRTTSTRSRSSRRCSTRGTRQRRRRGSEMVDRAFVARARAARVARVAALWSPDSGIVNAEELVKALLRTRRGGRRHVPAGHAARRRRRRRRTASRFGRSAKRSRRTGRQRRRSYADECRGCSAARRSRSIRAAASTRSSTPAKRSLVNALVYPLPHAPATASACTWCGPPAARSGSDRRFSIRTQGRLRRRPAAGRSVPRAGAPLLPRRHARRPAAVGQRHPRRSCIRRASRSPTS